MGRLETSFEIFKQSLRILMAHKKLLLFPVVNFIGIILILAFFFGPLIYLQFTVEGFTLFPGPEAGEHQVSVQNFLIGSAFYIILMFVLTFFNVAYYNEILHAFNEQPVSISGGFRFACSRLKAIFMWSLLSGLVGMIIRKIEDSVGFFGKWVFALIGFAWSAASIFVIPVIIREESQADPVQNLKSSAALIRKTWGEGLAGIGGLYLFSILLSTSMVFMIIVLVGVFHAFIPAMIVAVVMVTLMVLQEQVKSVFLCGLYIYASEGVVPGTFSSELFDRAWKVKKPKGQ